MGFEQTDMTPEAISEGSGQDVPEGSTAWVLDISGDMRMRNDVIRVNKPEDTSD